MGAFPLHLAQVQPDRVLGPAQGGHHQEEPQPPAGSGWPPAGPTTAERHHQEQAAKEVGGPRDNLQRPARPSPLI